MRLIHLHFVTRFLVVTGILFVCIIVLPIWQNTARADTRSISLYMINTRQKLTVTYKINGRFVPDALKKINNLLRDWRANESIRMSPKLIDLLWELHRELGSKREIHVVSGYRSPKTNAMLRRKSKGVAKKSNHMIGLAADVFFPDVSVRTLREAGILKRLGGVGYYPGSRFPFVHIDVGSTRHWPRMKATELAALFKRGKPSAGYAQKPLTTTIASTSNSAKSSIKTIQRIVIASAPKPISRPQLTTFTPTRPTKTPDTLLLRPSISDPEILAEQILLASIFADEEDGDILSLEEYSIPMEITTNLSTKQDLSFYPIRSYPDLELLEVPISIGLSSNDADRLLRISSNRFIGSFKKVPYPDISVQPFRRRQ